MRKIHSLLLSVISLMWLPACGQKTFDEKMESLYRNTVPLITSTDFNELKQNSEPYVLDTRATKEYQVSHIPGAHLLDYDNFDEEDLKKIPKDAEIVVYCSVGYRSERIGEKLQKLGYENVHNLYGGIFDWKNQGNQVINNHNQPTDSVHAYNSNWSKWLYNGIKVYE